MTSRADPDLPSPVIIQHSPRWYVLLRLTPFLVSFFPGYSEEEKVLFCVSHNNCGKWSVHIQFIINIYTAEAGVPKPSYAIQIIIPYIIHGILSLVK